ncbi:hypothetical protein FF2_046669 [Malus domestica]
MQMVSATIMERNVITFVIVDTEKRVRNMPIRLSTNMVENSGIDNIVAMVSMMHICMITELNMVAAIKSSDWWFNSGAIIHVCNDKAQFKTYEVSTDNQEVLMGNHNSAKVLGK